MESYEVKRIIYQSIILQLIDYHIQRIISYPFFITFLILSSILMLNISYQKPKLFLIVLGVLISVIIYYISFSLERWVKMKKFH